MTVYGYGSLIWLFMEYRTKKRASKTHRRPLNYPVQMSVFTKQTAGVGSSRDLPPRVHER